VVGAIIIGRYPIDRPRHAELVKAIKSRRPDTAAADIRRIIATDDVQSPGARGADVSGLLPTFIAMAGSDLFAAQDIAHAQRLNAAAMPVELLVVPGR
jgi:acetyl esterase/lipase